MWAVKQDITLLLLTSVFLVSYLAYRAAQQRVALLVIQVYHCICITHLDAALAATSVPTAINVRELIQILHAQRVTLDFILPAKLVVQVAQHLVVAAHQHQRVLPAKT